MISDSAPSTATDDGGRICVLCGNRFSDETRFCPLDGHPLRPARTEDPLVGTLLAGRYLVERKLGQGGMGSVYLADQVAIKRKVALKVLNQEGNGDPDAPLRFAREASNASRLTHQHVASVYDFGEEPKTGVLFLAMEFVEGESLGALIAREQRLPPRRAATIAWQIADALASAHELGVVHRDLKPDNVMITRRPDGGDFVKVVDFGISRAIDSTTQQVTRTGFAIGTPQYMSPEQLLTEPSDERTDVFALGLVCYVMLTGELPWPSVAREQVLAQRLTMSRRTLADIDANTPWPAGVQSVLDEAIAVKPEMRSRSIVQFATDLMFEIQQWMPDSPTADAPWERGLRLGTPVSTARIVSDAVSATRAASGATDRAQRAPTDAALPAERSATRRPSVRSVPLLAGVVTAVAAAGFFGFVQLQKDRAPRDTTAVDTTTAKSGGVGASPLGVSNGDRDSAKVLASDTGRRGGAAVKGGGARTQEKPSAGTPAAGSPDPASGTTGGGANAPDAGDALTPQQLREMLDRLAGWTTFDAPVESTTRALQLIPRLLGVVRTPADTVEVRLREAEAHLRLDQPREACVALRDVASRAPATRFRAQVATLMNDPELNCRNR